MKQSTYDTIRNLLIGEDLENVINESIEDSNNSQELANEMADEIAEEDATDEIAEDDAEEDASDEIEDDNMILIWFFYDFCSSTYIHGVNLRTFSGSLVLFVIALYNFSLNSSVFSFTIYTGAIGEERLNIILSNK